MKRFGRLWPQVVAFENLLQAAKQAQRAKRFRENVLAFNDRLESELFQPLRGRDAEDRRVCPLCR